MAPSPSDSLSREADARTAISVAVVEHDPLARNVGNDGIRHHLGIPALARRHVQDTSFIVASPGDAVSRLGVTHTIAVAAARLPHAIPIRVLDHTGPAKRVLVRRLVVDTHKATP